MLEAEIFSTRTGQSAATAQQSQRLNSSSQALLRRNVNVARQKSASIIAIMSVAGAPAAA